MVPDSEVISIACDKNSGKDQIPSNQSRCACSPTRAGSPIRVILIT